MRKFIVSVAALSIMCGVAVSSVASEPIDPPGELQSLSDQQLESMRGGFGLVGLSFNPCCIGGTSLVNLARLPPEINSAGIIAGAGPIFNVLGSKINSLRSFGGTTFIGVLGRRINSPRLLGRASLVSLSNLAPEINSARIIAGGGPIFIGVWRPRINSPRLFGGASATQP